MTLALQLTLQLFDMALNTSDLVVIQEMETADKQLMKCTVGNLFTDTAELVGIDGGTTELSPGEYDYPDA